MTENEFTLLYEIKKSGVLTQRSLSDCTSLSTGFISQTLNIFKKKEWIDKKCITEKGLQALLPYKVDNAVIMAAGLSSRFVPLSLEKPKGLLVVKNEVLIERQIKQLKEAGINEIVLVLGYKKEAFFYLEDKFDNLRIIINPQYNTKNNTHTLYLAQKYIKNSYICSSDYYYTENPFDEYVYRAYYSSVYVDTKTDEWYMNKDSKGNIAKVSKSGNSGFIMLGHAYWDRQFSLAMINYLNEDFSVGNYDSSLWEQLLADNIKKLPPMKIKEYSSSSVFEFDSLDELRKFDNKYVKHTESQIMKNISVALKCKESDIRNFKAIKEGLTNTSFMFEISGRKYVYRHPGEGTDKIISRSDEKKALTLAKELGADPTFIYMDEQSGWKISSFVENARTPSYNSFEDSKRIIDVLKKLHKTSLSLDRTFLPWEEAEKIEIILRSQNSISDTEFFELKKRIKKCYEKCLNDGIKICFCHCDTYAPNWLLNETQTILIDWEYAGNADPGCDLGTYIMDSMWEIEEAKKFIQLYYDNKATEKQVFHHLAYTAIVSYYWYVWALYREACGSVMGESLYNWHTMAKKYSAYLCKEISEDK